MIHLATAVAGQSIDTSTITSVIVGIGIPFLVDLVTKSHVAPKVKATAATALAALSGAVTTVIFDPSTGWKGYVYNIFFAFATAMTVHRTGATDGVQRRTHHFGFGKHKHSRTTINPTPTHPGTPHAGRPPTKATPRKSAAKKVTPRKSTPRKRA